MGKKTLSNVCCFCLSFGLVVTVLLFNRAVVPRDMSRSQDTIFQSLGLEGLKPRSRLGLGTSKSRKMASLGHISKPSVKTRNDFKFLTEKTTTNPFLFKSRVLKVIP